MLVKCELCNGSGMMDCTLEYGPERHPENCPGCGGEQKVICIDCNGTGKVEE